MIEITFTPADLRLEIKGHAQWAEKGKDIVCAAVSILCYTLAESLTESDYMLESKTINLEDGCGDISCKPKDKFRPNIEMMYWTVLNGFELLSKEYKDFINFSVRC